LGGDREVLQELNWQDHGCSGCSVYELNHCFEALRLLYSTEMASIMYAESLCCFVSAATSSQTGYLESTGFAARGLIGAEGADSSSSADSASGTALAVVPKDSTKAPAAAEGGFWATVAVGIAGEVEELGKGLLRVSKWLKLKVGLTGQASGQKGEDGQAVGEEDEAESARKVGGRFMQLVGVAMLAIVMVVIVRKPGVFGRLFRRRF
jgi:hypothetical protein